MMIVRSLASLWRIRMSARGLWDSRPAQVSSDGGVGLVEAVDRPMIIQAQELTLELRMTSPTSPEASFATSRHARALRLCLGRFRTRS